MSNLTENVIWEQFVNKIENGEHIDADLLNAAAQNLANRTAWLRQIALSHAQNESNPHNTTPAKIGAETPSGAQTKVNNHAVLLDAHAATPSLAGSRIMMRDVQGQCHVGVPTIATHIARLIDVNDRASVGWGHAWQNLTAQRAVGSTYVNQTGRPIFVSVIMAQGSSSWGVDLQVNGLVVARQSHHTYQNSTTICAIVPPLNNYKVVVSHGTSSLVQWNELR